MNRSALISGVMSLLISAGCGSPSEPSSTSASNNAGSSIEDRSENNSSSNSSNRSSSDANVNESNLRSSTADADSNAVIWEVSEHPLRSTPVVYSSGREAKRATILESLGGGVGVLDFDGDGRIDCFFPGGGKFGETADHQPTLTASPNTLLRNVGAMQFVDVTSNAAVAMSTHYSHGCAAGDFNSDGFVDLLVSGYGGLQLWQNQGDGSFVVIAPEASRLLDDSWSTSVAWGDLNGDSLPDLYVPHYVDWSFENDPQCTGEVDRTLREICSPRRFNGLRDRCYLNQGDGTFQEVTDLWNLPAAGKGLGAMILDLNGDLINDVYVANDTSANFLLLGSDSGLIEQGELSGSAFDDRGIPNGSMGIAAADFDRNGLFDLWVANYQSETFALYRQTRAGLFNYSSPRFGLRLLVPEFVAFGTVVNDIDRDGNDDILVTNGHVLDYPAGAPRDQQTLALRRSGEQFVRLAWPADHPFTQARCGRGLAAADLDDDGDADFVFTPSDQPAWLLQNNEAAQGRALTITPIGVDSARIPIGATLTVKTDQASRIQALVGGGSYLSTHQACFFVTIPNGEQVQSIELRWPNGQTQEITLDDQTTALTVIEKRRE